MRCPKCGFHTFDYLDNCKKCNTDLRPFKTPKLTASAIPPATPPPAPALADLPSVAMASPPPAAPNPATVWPSPMSPPASPLPPLPMAAPAPGGISLEQERLMTEKLKLEGKLKSGASWFYVIAALSLVNSIIIFFGGSWNFVVGLGVTRFVDVIAQMLSQQLSSIMGIIGLAFSLFIAGIFVVLGIFAGKRKTWGFITGMILYALDGLLCLAILDFFSAGFHALALLFIFMGLRAKKKLGEIEQKLGAAAY